MNKKFDFSEIDGALPTAEKMQEQDRIIDALKNNYEAVRILSANVEKLENRLSEALPKMDGAVSSLRGASTVTLGEEARKTLEQEEIPTESNAIDLQQFKQNELPFE